MAEGRTRSCFIADSLSLRLGEGERPVQTSWLSRFSILSTSAARGYGSGQQVACVGRAAAQLEADQMVLLEVRAGSAEAVLRQLHLLQVVRVRHGRPHCACPPATQIVERIVCLGHVGIQDARRARPARPDERRPDAWLGPVQEQQQDDGRTGSEKSELDG